MTEFWLQGCESPLEEAFRVGMHEVRPFTQCPHHGSICWAFWHVEPQRQIGSARVDLYLQSPVEVVVELDGNRYHAGQARIQTDVARERRLVALGLKVIRFTGPEVFRSPTARAHELAEALDMYIEGWLSGRRGEVQLRPPYVLREWTHTRVP